MFAHPRHSSSNRRRLQDDALTSKLLAVALKHAAKANIDVDAIFIDAVQRAIQSRIANGQLQDRELRAIVLDCGVPRSVSQAAVVRDAAEVDDAPRAPIAKPRAATPAESFGSQQSPTREMLLNTSKRQRQMLADAKWIEQAEDDREQGFLRRKEEKQKETDRQRRQREALQSQLDEHDRDRQAAARARRKAQDDMTQAILDNRNATMQEKRDAFNRAQREKDFREKQVGEMEQQRENQRSQEHNEQVRHMMMLQQELQRQRAAEAEQKATEKAEWKKVLSENEERLREKAMAKERTRAEDRRYQREYEENLDRVERERAEARARKEARAAKFQQMANVVAEKHLKKVQNVDDKIEAEYDEQQRRSLEDERNRRLRAKQRILETHEVIQNQLAEKEAEKARRKAEERRLAEALAEQAEEAARQERARKAAMRSEAARMKQFLSTQLQLQHFRETRPLETSITRPESRGTTMYTPSRYTPSPKPTL
jgi:hypothetical protein